MTDHLPKGWTRKRIDELGQLYSGSTPSTHVVAYWGDEIVWVTPNDLSKLRTRYITNSERRITEVGLRNCSAHLLPKGSLIISSRAPIGYLAIAQTDFCTNQGCKSLVFSSEQDPDFHYYNLSFRVKSIKEKGEGTTFAEISKSALAKIEVPVPVEKAEQTAIADILSTVDQAIAQTEALIAKQRRIKAGLLHDLLTRGIDEHGQLRDPATHRFKQTAVGWVPEEWEVKRISSYADVLGGKRLPAGHNYTETSTGYCYLRVLDFFEKTISFSDLANLEEATFKALERYEIASGELFVSIAGSIGFCGVLRVSGPDRIILTENAAKIRLRSNFVPEFLAMQINGHQVQQQITEAKGTGGGVPKLALFRIENLHVARPSVAEQTDIVRHFVAVESALNDLTVELSKFNRLKIGLMQDLLSGRVSVAGMVATRPA